MMNFLALEVTFAAWNTQFERFGLTQNDGFSSELPPFLKVRLTVRKFELTTQLSTTPRAGKESFHFLVASSNLPTKR